jgi:predicted amidohydrolase YtcJ
LPAIIRLGYDHLIATRVFEEAVMGIRTVLSAAAVILLTLPCRAAHCQPPADLVLLGGKIVTLDPQSPVVEALAASEGRIVAVGSDAEVQPRIGDSTRVIQLHGKLALPGFIDSHGHFVSLGRSKRILDLTRARDYDDIVRLVKATAAKTPAGRWIEGRGWHQDKWGQPPEPCVEGYPTHDQLSRATPAHPVLLTHASGHMCLANAKAMELAGVDERTKDPPGGEVLRDSSGKPTGVFREAAGGPVHAAKQRAQAHRTAGQVLEELDDAVRLAGEECLAHGVTSFQDAGSSLATIDRLRELARSGRLNVRLWVMIGEPNSALAARLPQYRIIGDGDCHLTVRGIKRFMDGALGTHGAWFLEPYEDLPDSIGVNTTPPEAIRKTAQLAIEHDFQLCVHAIGDRANRLTLDVFEDVFRANPAKTGLRWRIEHAQHLHPSDVPRFAKLGVIASMQGVHCTSDAAFALKRLGPERAREGAYVWRKLLDADAVVSNGTDAPVERVDPIACFYASVTRKPAGAEAFFPEQRMTRQEALRSYTIDAAYAAFEEHIKGSLTPGKLADIVVLSHDILTVPEEEILKARVLYTIVGGKVLYERRTEVGGD